VITSTANQFVKIAASLHNKKGRQEHGLFLVEGPHLVVEALRAGADIRRYFWTTKWGAGEAGRVLLRRLAEKAEGLEVSEPVMAKLAETETSQGIAAVVAIPSEPGLDLSGLRLALVLDSLQDPGNVGTIIRTAWAAGLDCLLLTAGTADPYQGKVVRATMGGLFHQRIYTNLSPAVIATAARQAGLQIIAGALGADCSYLAVDLTVPTLLLVGNEGKGITEEWDAYGPCKVFIPQPGNAESLNVSVTAGILIYEVIRQRLEKSACPGTPL
jgi:TrmH family RNA methyltransferase